MVSGILLGTILYVFTRFLNYVETRAGVQLNDPLLMLFDPIDLTWITFAAIYLSLTAGLFYLIKNPDNLILAIQSYIIMVLFRTVTMYVTPLDPPAGMIMLKDPLVEILGTGREMSRDLFFSGHTATLFILYLATSNKKIKYIFLLMTLIVAAAVLIQHVHYSIDVAAAFVFTYSANRLSKKIRNKFINKATIKTAI